MIKSLNMFGTVVNLQKSSTSNLIGLQSSDRLANFFALLVINDYYLTVGS